MKAAAREHGLWYPPDPSSFEICSIGGNLATNAGGLCCVKYGVTTDYVLGLEVVLADGRAVRLGGRTIKDVAGYDLKRLFVGSEGTLGVITEATLRLRPLPPPAATDRRRRSPTWSTPGGPSSTSWPTSRPAALELMDAGRGRRGRGGASRWASTPAIGALLLGQSDGQPRRGRRRSPRPAARRPGATYVAVTDDPDEGELLMGARRMAIPCVERLGTVLIEDVGVPIPRIPDLVAAVETIAETPRHRRSR